MKTFAQQIDTPDPQLRSKLTDEVVSRYKVCPDPRLKEIMISLIKHLHSFAREVKLTEAEWIKGIEFLTRVGQFCNETRQEFILLSDVLGLAKSIPPHSKRLATGVAPAWEFVKHFPREAAPH